MIKCEQDSLANGPTSVNSIPNYTGDNSVTEEKRVENLAKHDAIFYRALNKNPPK